MMSLKLSIAESSYWMQEFGFEAQAIIIEWQCFELSFISSITIYGPDRRLNVITLAKDGYDNQIEYVTAITKTVLFCSIQEITLMKD